MNRFRICIAAAGFLIGCGVSGSALGGLLSLPSRPLDRSGKVPIVYHFKEGFTGRARLRIRWTDSLDRLVIDRTIQTELVDETRITFSIDTARAVAMKNHLRADLSLEGSHFDGTPYIETDRAEADFVARPPYTGWQDYVVMMWQPYAAERLPALKKLGVTAGQYSGRSTSLPDFLIDNNMRWYSESLAPAFYAQYHRWYPDRPKTWSFMQAKARYRENPDSLAAFKRHPSFEDPRWRQRVHDRGVATAKRNAPFRPYFYSLSDEAGIADLGAQWDFDFSDQSLVPMRRWLRTQYASLGALNREWGTDFSDWHHVMPLTTNQAMQKPGNNFAAWADFKTWMDISFADALKLGADAIREGDPKAYVGIVGAQMPGWGGYDYARLTKALNIIEPYDIGRSVDIVHSLDPSMPILSTSFASGPWEKHRVWRALLHGNHGLIVWDAQHAYVGPDAQPSAKGRKAAEYYKELRSGIGALIINSRLVNDRIAIHYSQPSLRTQWLLERRPRGEAWMQRSASYERTQNHFMRVRESWSNLIADLGMQYDFVAYDQLPDGELLKGNYPALILPRSSSLSQAEAQAIRAFVAAGGIAIADSVPGTYNEHSRKLAQPLLADLFGEPRDRSLLSDVFGHREGPRQQIRRFGQGKAVLLNMDIAGYLQDRLEGTEGPVHRTLEKLLRANDVRPRLAVEDEAGRTLVGVDLRVFANGGVRLVSLQSNPQQRVNELGPPDFQSNERFEKPITAKLRLPRSMYVYNTRKRRALGRKSELKLTLDPYEPTILAVSPVPLPEMRVSMPDRAQRGSKITIAVHATPTPAATNVFHIDVRNPKGERVLHYSDNLIVEQGGGSYDIPLAANDMQGDWTITMQDMLSGQTVEHNLAVD